MTSNKTRYLVSALVGAVIVTGAMAGVDPRASRANPGMSEQYIKASTAPIFAPPPGAPLSFADIFETVSPAVVSINVTSKVDPEQLRRQIPGLPFDIIPRQGQPDEEGDGAAPKGKSPKGGPTQQSAGSGFFISADGYIVTNNHVVENADTIKVVLKDETELDAVVIGRDEGTDLAVLKVKGSNFAFVSFENAARPRVGDWVFTVGNPFGLGGTATAGIVSAYGRDIGEKFVDYIQIDAPINRGNSGGPTFDVYGRVIGVNTAIFSPSGGSVGIGFAIPADVADPITRQLIAGGKIKRGYIGATIQNFDSDMAEAQGMAGQKAAIVADLVPGGPAQKAGLVPGDIVLSVNGIRVKSSSELTREVVKASPGATLRLAIIREGKPRTLDITSGLRPSEQQIAANDNRGGNENSSGPGSTPKASVYLGMTLAPLDEATRRKIGVDASARGMVITAIERNSDAAEKGLQPNDLLVRAGDRPVTAASDLSAVIESAKKADRKSILIGVYRGGRTIFLPLKVAG